MSNPTADLTLEQGVEHINAESGGLLRVEVITPEDLWPLSCAVFAGDAGALVRLEAVYTVQTNIRRNARKVPALCLSCPRSVKDPDTAVALLAPTIDLITISIAAAMCPKCSEGGRDLMMERAAGGFRRIWSDLRCIEVTHPEGGRA